MAVGGKERVMRGAMMSRPSVHKRNNKNVKDKSKLAIED
jgi:hypothetical protein